MWWGSGGVLVEHWWGSGGVPVGQLAHAALQLLVESVPWGPCHQPVTCQASIRSFDDDGRFVQRQSRTSRLPCMQFCSIFVRGSKINGRASSVQSELLCSVCVQCRQASLTPSIQESEIPLDNSTSQSVHSSSQQNYSTGRYNYRTSQYILHLHL